MVRHFKQIRFGRLLSEAASDPRFFDQAHVIFGGTGAVGGATALHILGFFDETARYRAMRQERPPRIVVTGHTHREIRAFTHTFYGVHQRAHRSEPERLEGQGYRTASGAVLEMRTLSIDPAVAEIRNCGRLGSEERQQAAEGFLHARGLRLESPLQDKVSALSQAIEKEGAQPFTRFLESFRQDRQLPEGKFQSVVVTIPLASVATYQLGDLEALAKAMGIEGQESLEDLKEAYLQEFPADLGNVAKNLAREVLVAHTTGVGGMFDEDAQGRRSIRLGFAHSGAGEKLVEKQLFADKLAELYSERGIRMLVTAAAIGIDEIQHKKAPPVQAALQVQLANAMRRHHSVIPDADAREKVLHVYQPRLVDLKSPSDSPLAFRRGIPLVLDYVIKSGENGYFTVSNADALYRIMKVASATELGFLLARTAAFGDDPLQPRFVDNICNYTETDYSRQVFDLLGQKALFSNQLTGLQPKALQDLGSARHQAEMHTLGLLILLHRLKTLDLSKIEHRVDLSYFDPMAYFEANSQALTLDEAAEWNAEELARDLSILANAAEESDLAPLKSFTSPHAQRREAFSRVMQAVLRAIWAIPSLGSPILYQSEDGEKLALGPFVAAIDRVATHESSPFDYLKQEFEQAQQAHGRPLDDHEDYQRFSEFHFVNGFVDLRPQATLVTAHSHQEDLQEKVHIYRSEDDFLRGLEDLKPYSYFAAGGLVALLVRLKGLARSAHEMNFELGTANEYRVHFAYDETGRALLVPGVVEALRLVSEGLEKNTGAEWLDGFWGYGWP